MHSASLEQILLYRNAGRGGQGGAIRPPPPVFGRTANQGEQIMPTKLLLPPHPKIFGPSVTSVYPIPMHWITISYEFPA